MTYEEMVKEAKDLFEKLFSSIGEDFRLEADLSILPREILEKAADEALSQAKYHAKSLIFFAPMAPDVLDSARNAFKAAIVYFKLVEELDRRG